jgi:hypothetical protein
VPAEPPAPQDQRRDERYLCLKGGALRLAIRPIYRGRRAVLVDVAAGGLCLLLETPLAEGTVLAVELGGCMGSNRVARVRYCRQQSWPDQVPAPPRPGSLAQFVQRLFSRPVTPPPRETAWQVGCAFDRPLSAEELAELLQLLTPTPPTVDRTNARPAVPTA